MSLVAVGVTLGTPDSAGEIPVTTSNLAGSIASAVSDLSTLTTAIGTANTAATTANTDVGTAQTAANTAATATGTAVTNMATTLTAIDAFGAAVIAITGGTYTAHQFSVAVTTGLTNTQCNTTFALLNTAITDFLAAQTQVGTSNSDAAAVVTDLATAKTAANTTATDVAALSTTAVSSDLTNSQAVLASANVFIQTDSSVVTAVSALNGALVAALTFVRKNSILPT